MSLHFRPSPNRWTRANACANQVDDNSKGWGRAR